MDEKLTPIEEAINIGEVLAGRLRSVNVPDLETLKDMGDTEAYARLSTLYPDCCYHERLALAGAVRDIRWHYLPKEVKQAVKIEVEQ